MSGLDHKFHFLRKWFFGAREECAKKIHEISDAPVQEVERLKHDLRSPLVALECLLDARKTEGGLLVLEQQDVWLFETAVKRLGQILNPKEHLEAGIVQALTEVSREAEQVLSRLKGCFHVIIHNHLSHQPACKVSEIELKRIVINLLVNAAEAGADKVLIRVNDEMISVEDNGRGVPIEILGRLGQERVSYGKCNLHSGAGEFQSGNGIGVYSAAVIFRQSGGDLRVSNTKGSGARFDLIFSAIEKH